ncbi:hypothetical protein BC940DRAFT_301549 [Gongronella butleri]|nr:hypothetical protein BC940DRAFT_301549 [Gongronella butleri]
MPTDSFDSLCKLMERISNTSAIKDRKALFRNYLQFWRKKYQQDFYPAMRLLLPGLDKSRYHMKESKLARVYISVLKLSPSSEAATSLLDWKKPSTTDENKPVGDFAAIAYRIIQERSTVTNPTKTVEDVNNLLDNLQSGDVDDASRKKFFQEIVSSYSAREQHWLIRIILRDLKIGMTDNTMLNEYHWQAKDYYQTTSNLKLVCDDLMDPNTKIDDPVIQLTHAFQPQLSRKGFAKDFVSLKSTQDGTFYVEEKIDGERTQMHFNKQAGVFQWFTRKGTDYTHYFGSSSTDHRKLSGHVADLITVEKNIILDGELVAYDPVGDVYMPFGTLKTAALQESMDSDKPHPCFVVFDVVFIDDRHVYKYPLRIRLQELSKYVTDKYGYLHLLPRKTLPLNPNNDVKQEEKEILQVMEEMIEQRMEGVVLKSPDAPYMLNERAHSSWLKIKPDFYDALGDTFDLLVVGGKYGTGRRSKRLAQFMCALRVQEDQKSFVSFCMVGTGFKLQEFEMFEGMLKDCKQVAYDPYNLPPWFKHPEKSTEKPDVIFPNFNECLVFEIKGSEIVPSTTWSAGYTLRFPRYKALREDKDWSNVNTVPLMRKRMNEKSTSIDWMQPTKKPRVVRRAMTQPQLLASQQGADLKNVQKLTDLFASYTFYVVDTNSHPKTPLELLIASHGGKLLQTHKHSTPVTVIAGEKIFTVDSLIAQDIDILRPEWLLDSVHAQKILPLEPKYMLHAGSNTRNMFKSMMDDYGDSYTERATTESLNEIFARDATKPATDATKLPTQISDAAAQDLRKRYFNMTPMPGMFFTGAHAYFDEPVSDENATPMERVNCASLRDKIHRLRMEFEFYGGTAVDSLLDQRLTHIITPQHQKEQLTALIKQARSGNRSTAPYVVPLVWVQQCIQNQTHLDESAYNPVSYNLKHEEHPFFIHFSFSR